MALNKNHWYDGWFYERFIAPNQDDVFILVDSLIEDGASVLDVGTGTGRLLLKLADKCSRVYGIDLSTRNVERAREGVRRHSLANVSVHHADIEDLFGLDTILYDYAVLSYVIHEIDLPKREEILLDLSAHARTIIVVDYAWPRPNVLLGAFNEVVEFTAGMDHYRNFKSFMANKGLPGLVERTGLRLLNEVKNHPAGAHVIALSKHPTR
ncbi:MAG: class I SAM-dependent methyltransferase [Bacteroidetes bacterium]|nr:class I SAM-dependent methyltransferase [Bacteroidota bacterium]